MHPKRRRSLLRWLAAPLVVALTAVGCGSGGGGEGGRTEVRFLIAPDPLWDYMVEQGLVAEYEERYNMTIRTTQSWDEFQFFAGGHGDIVSMGTLELPILEEETGVDTVTFGRYNSFRSTPAARCDKGYETMEDLPKGAKIGVNSPLSSTILWDIYTREKYGFPFEVNNKETPYEMVVEDHFVMPEHIVRGGLDAGVIIPEAGAPFLRTGELCYMYGGRASWEVFRELMPNPDHKGVLSNGFTSTKKFYDEHPDIVKGFLALWDRGLQEWKTHKEDIVRSYPQHFAVEEEPDVKYIVDYLNSEHDYFQPTVYLDEEWVDNESVIYDLMKKYGLMNKNQENPEFAVVEPAEGQ